MLPLSRRPGEPPAHTVIIPQPTSPEIHDLRAGEGHDWLHGIAGPLGLGLGDQDVVRTAGEVADVDSTRAQEC
ncbi:hypothetical protein ACI78R_10755 [Geodermatophilus sp. SYSU D01106]